MPKNVLVAMALVLFVVAFISLQKGLEKGNFIDGMWSNSKEGVYVYIDDKVDENNEQGGYVVSGDMSANEPFKINIGKVNRDTKTVPVTVSNSNFLAKKFDMKVKIKDGIMEVKSKSGKKIKLFRDNETSEEMKKHGSDDKDLL